MRILTTAIIIFFSFGAMAQDGRFEKLYITPGITAGFTLGATFNIGLNVDFSTSITNDYDKIRRSGISVGHYLILHRNGNSPDHISHLDLKYENEFMDLRGGYGFLSHRWGRAKINKGGLGGFNFDISFTNRTSRIPWFGVRTFLYNQREWIWFDTPYVSFYARQKFYLTGGN